MVILNIFFTFEDTGWGTFFKGKLIIVNNLVFEPVPVLLSLLAVNHSLGRGSACRQFEWMSGCERNREPVDEACTTRLLDFTPLWLRSIRSDEVESATRLNP